MWRIQPQLAKVAGSIPARPHNFRSEHTKTVDSQRLWTIATLGATQEDAACRMAEVLTRLTPNDTLPKDKLEKE